VIDPVWIDERDALTLHDRLLALHGGAQGIRDLNLLQSALARPRHLLADGHEPQILTLAAAYAFGIVRNHPFADGNKRTGFLVSILFFELNGFRFVATEESAAQAIISLAAGTMTEDTFGRFLRDNTKPQS
jgi:death-on-curing protein